MHGFILIDKREGVSSAQVVGLVKRLLRESGRIGRDTKIGHGGTLDPMATGLLVVLVGRATRLADLALHGDKHYSGEIRLGMITDTDDRLGKCIEQRQVDPDSVINALPSVIERFTGSVRQRPPAFSALKVDGQRAYELARKGVAVELDERVVTLRDLCLEFDGSDCLRFSVSCSGGTYIRSLARDIGAMLGCGATLASLRREQVNHLSVTGAIPQVELEGLSVGAPLELQPWWRLLPDAPVLSAHESETAQLARGDVRALGALTERLEGSTLNQGAFLLYGHSPETRSGVESTKLSGASEVIEPCGVVRWLGSRLDLVLHVG